MTAITTGAVYQRRRRTALAKGEPLSRDPRRAQQHVRLLVESGFRVKEIARAAGVSAPALYELLDGTGAIFSATEARILATSQADVERHCREVSSTVPMLMLRALTALGWSPANIAQAATLSTQTVRDTRDMPRPRVHRSTADLIERAYDRLTDMRAPKGPVADRMRALAQKRGWEAPTRWEKAA